MNIENINNKAKLLIEETYKDSAKWHQNFNEAKQLLESALAQESNNETSLINYATILCDIGNHQEATEFFKKAINQGSENKHAFYNLGVALINCSSHENAMIYMQKAKSKKAGTLTWQAYFDPMGH
ncbi:hypothetical protein WN093_07800 [Gammaproteobacteria bacterium AS21]|jgi:tetratricopeptide (TPR) repeat protein